MPQVSELRPKHGWIYMINPYIVSWRKIYAANCY